MSDALDARLRAAGTSTHDGVAYMLVQVTAAQSREATYGDGPILLTREQARQAHWLGSEELRRLNLWNDATTAAAQEAQDIARLRAQHDTTSSAAKDVAGS